MSKHTPGPWRIDARPFHQHGRMHIGCGHYIVATALGQTQSCEEGATANARLIAVAPELFNLARQCEDLLCRTYHGDEMDGGAADTLITALRAALDRVAMPEGR